MHMHQWGLTIACVTAVSLSDTQEQVSQVQRLPKAVNIILLDIYVSDTNQDVFHHYFQLLSIIRFTCDLFHGCIDGRLKSFSDGMSTLPTLQQ